MPFDPENPYVHVDMHRVVEINGEWWVLGRDYDTGEFVPFPFKSPQKSEKFAHDLCAAMENDAHNTSEEYMCDKFCKGGY